MSSYYNEIDPFAAQWLRELIAQGHIADGVVDERSIEYVKPDDLAGFTQCHFFAGVGVWSYALRQAGWPDDRPVWTGSCPCPPFSSAGKRKMCPACGGKPVCHAYRTGCFRCTSCGHDWVADGRHLWPELYRLICERRPGVCFGEQVAGRDGDAWGDIVQSCLEIYGYAVGRVPFAACGVGSPQQRKRLYWVADADSSAGRQRRAIDRGHQGGDAHPGARSGGGGDVGGLANADSQRREKQHTLLRQKQKHYIEVARRGPTNGHWRNADWLGCRDEKWRPVEPGTFPLADGAPARVGRLRGYGNAIVAQQAAAFVEAVMGHLADV
jgi:DNA (cytosine-5)-methyltransferase 1